MTKFLQKGDDLKMVMIVFEELTHELMLPFSPGNSALIFLISLLISQSCQNGLAGQVVQGGQSGQSGLGGQGGQGGSGGPGCPLDNVKVVSVVGGVMWSGVIRKYLVYIF